MSDSAGRLSVAAADLKPDEMYLLLRDAIVPRPIAWVSSIDRQGRSNIAPYSFFNVCSADPPVLGFSCGSNGRDPATGQLRVKDTLANIRATRQMVINLVPESLIEAMVKTSASLAPGESEFEFAGLTPAACEKVRPPRVANAPVAFECSLYSILEIGSSWWVMGEVLQVHIAEEIHLGEVKGLRHRVDPTRDEAHRPVGRLGRANYTRIREIQTILRPDGPNE